MKEGEPVTRGQELARSGQTGYLVSNVEEAVSVIDAAAGIDRAACRALALERFSATRMVDDYRRVYDAVIAGNDSGPSRAGHPHHVS